MVDTIQKNLQNILERNEYQLEEEIESGNIVDVIQKNLKNILEEDRRGVDEVE